MNQQQYEAGIAEIDSVCTELDFGCLGKRQVEIEYEDDEGHAHVTGVWVDIADRGVVDVLAYLCDKSTNHVMDMAEQDNLDHLMAQAEDYFEGDR